MFDYVLRIFTLYALLFLAIWLVAGVCVNMMLRSLKKKSRVRRASEQRQGKLYTERIAPFQATVKSEAAK